MSYFHKKHQKGFTLVELLVVIAIIGILSSLLLLQLGTARSKARDAKRIADINQIRSALELFFDDNGNYPLDALNNTEDNAGTTYLTPNYIQQMPEDPLTKSQIYGYAYQIISTRRTRYHIWAEMELRGNWQAGDADADSTEANWVAGAEGQGFADGAIELCADKVVGAGNKECVYDQAQTL